MKKRILLGVIIGGPVGYLYYYFIGCYSGTCAITSNPINSTIYGAILGALVIELISDMKLSVFRKLKNNKKEINEKIMTRYEEESSSSCTLGCGNTLENLNVEKGEIILDLGCGRGEDTILISKMTGATGKAVGLDLTKEMIQVANEKAMSENIANVNFVQGDIEMLPFDDNSFDGVVSNCVINHAKDKRKVYSEIYRVLKPGGRFIVADAVTKYPLPMEVKNDPEAWAQCYGGSITEEEYLESIYSSGFENIDIINKREYLKNGYDFASLTIKAVK